MRVGEIRELSDEEILDQIEDLKATMFRLRLEQSSGQLENTNHLRYTRRDIARCHTVLNERRLAAEVASEEASNA